MRILVATGIYPPEIGGPATHTVLMEEQLPAYGHAVTVLPFRVSRKYPKGIRHLHYFFTLLRASRHADVLFAQDVLSVGLPALLVATLTQKPFVVRVPGDYAWEQATQRYGVTDTIDEFQTKKYGWRVTLLRWLQQRVVQGATKVVTPSNYFYRLVSGWGVRRERIVTIYNGVDLSLAPSPVSHSYAPLMVTAGRLVPWKGFSMLITILAALPEWHLVIIGSGPDEQALRAQIEKKGLTNRVHVIGSITRAELLGWCQSADAFVLNTSFESFSYQIVEAMHVGVPVITTAVGSLPELITTDKEGVLLAPNDASAFTAAIRSVVNNPELWAKRTRQAQVKAKQFSIEATSAALDQLLKEVVA